MKDRSSPRADLTPLGDVAARGMRAIFVGINPGIRSAQTGHHFAGYSNRFWKLLHDSGLTPERLRPEEGVRLPQFGFGITNLVPRPTPGIGDLTARDYAAGRRLLLRKLSRWRPGVVALVGVTVYRVLLAGARRPPGERQEGALPWPLGPRDETLSGVPVFVLPNPSGRNANYPYGQMLAAFRAFKICLDSRRC